MTTITTTTTDLEPSLSTYMKVGDRVLVNSSKGMLAGRLRFLGHTDFAPGYWAGVELDEPVGKNDGTVAGKRWVYQFFSLFNILPLTLRLEFVLNALRLLFEEG